MKINLAEQAKRAGKKPGTVVAMPVIETTQSQAKSLARIYLSVVRVWQDAVRDTILPEYSRSLSQLTFDSSDDLNADIERTNFGITQAIISFQRAFESWAQQLNLWHLRKIVSGLTYRTNVNLETQMSAGDTQETINDVLNRNVALVRNVSDEARGRISDIVFRGLQNRTPVKDVAKQLQEALGLSRKRAIRIASDQTVKLSAALDKQRQIQLGFDAFKWIHSHKINYRPWHKERNGKIFSWNSEVARTDPPGSAPFCGCRAQGVMEIE